MKIKFLSFIASFFMVSFVITSCLDDDNNIEYSPDATIHAFALDTAGLGSYKFTIDQLSREIYNEDSLPVHADTIIDKILIKTLTTASGVVTMKDKSGNDSVLNINDSIDLRKELIIKVWSTEALAGISPNQTKEYKIKVNVHKHDPDSLRWKYMDKINDQIQITGEQKSIIFGSEVFTYSVVNSKLYVYKNSLTNFGNGAPQATVGLPEDKLPTSIIAFQFNRSKTMLYATSNGDGKVYESADGEKWNAFVLDLSFIGWNLLSTITFGIVGVLYVNPYVNTTWAEFYKVMRENALETGNATREELIGLRKEADI